MFHLQVERRQVCPEIVRNGLTPFFLLNNATKVVMPMPSKEASNVPCNGCVRCCIKDAVRLTPEDDPKAYETENHPFLKGGHLMIAHKRNGECIYLGSDGCMIHERKPYLCRVMDCRNIARNMPFTKARKFKILGIWQKGKELIKADK